MDIAYTVVACEQEEFAATAQINGRDIAVKIPGISLEMVSEDGSMGHTFRFNSDDVAAALLEFSVGTIVTVTLTPTP